MVDQFERTALLIGREGVEKLRNARVIIFGVGGVGGFAAEALARAGVGHISVVDNDTVSLTNLNRQIIALHSTIGQYKVDVIKSRLLDINPELDIEAHRVFYMPDTASMFDFSQYDYVIDAIDSVTGKIELVMQSNRCKTPIISAMGAGNKLHPELFEIADIYETSVCPLARVMRRELKKRGIERLRVVYSKEPPLTPEQGEEDAGVRRALPGSTSFTPSAAGLILAGEVVRGLLQEPLHCKNQ